MNPFFWARESIRRRGWVRTSRIASSAAWDILFDLRYHTKTARWVNASQLDTDSENKAMAGNYQATKADPFVHLLQELALPRESVFVDIGSGKGRVLLLAAMHGFRKVIGVEFSPRLCALARANIAGLARTSLLRCPIEVVEVDATKFAIGADHDIFYLYNPFTAPVLAQFLKNLARSIDEAPRPVWLIYNTPTHDTLIRESGLFPNRRCLDICGTEFVVHSR
jgi:SAM-dependent methyltransferase